MIEWNQRRPGSMPDPWRLDQLRRELRAIKAGFRARPTPSGGIDAGRDTTPGEQPETSV